MDKVRQLVGSLQGKTIGVLGLAFKPNTDDMREAASVDIMQALLAEGAAVKAYDPVAMPVAKALLRDIEYCHDAYQVASGADALLVVTEWNEFKQLDMLRIRSVMRAPVMVDGRNLYDGDELRRLGFQYRGTGRN